MKSPHVPCDGDSTDRQWQFAGAERPLGSGRLARRAVGHMDRDGRPREAEAGDDSDLGVVRAGE